MSKLAGKFTLVDKDADNFEKYMSAVGVNFVLKKAAKHLNQTIEIKLTANGVHVITTSTVKSSDETWEWDVERDVTTMDGRKCKGTMSKVSDSQMVMTEKWNGKQTTITMLIDENDQLVFELRAEGAPLCRRVHKRD